MNSLPLYAHIMCIFVCERLCQLRAHDWTKFQIIHVEKRPRACDPNVSSTFCKQTYTQREFPLSLSRHTLYVGIYEVYYNFHDSLFSKCGWWTHSANLKGWIFSTSNFFPYELTRFLLNIQYSLRYFVVYVVVVPWAVDTLLEATWVRTILVYKTLDERDANTNNVIYLFWTLQWHAQICSGCALGVVHVSSSSLLHTRCGAHDESHMQRYTRALG